MDTIELKNKIIKNEQDIVTTNEQLADIKNKQLKFVTYEMFGVVGDGVHDDGIEIKACHDYANANNLPVINLTGEYWIKNTRNIEIKTNTMLGFTKIHIDESHNSATPTFRVASNLTSESMTVGDMAILQSYLQKNIVSMSNLKHYKNCFVAVEDTNTTALIREDGRVYKYKEFFYLDTNGKVIGDINYNFIGVTGATIYPCDNNYLIVDGGIFYLSGNNNFQYAYAGFKIDRSRVKIKNQIVDIEIGNEDTALQPRLSFHYFNNVYDVEFENLQLTPCIKDRLSGADVSEGTYMMGGGVGVKITYKNIKSTAGYTASSDEYWGTMGCDYIKDLKIINSYLNRIDCHMYLCDLTVKDSKLTTHEIKASGFGTMSIENTTVENSDYFIEFRVDYASFWDGDIRIKNCKLKVRNGSEGKIIYFYANKDFDFGRQIIWGKNIIIEDFEFISLDGNENLKYGIIEIGNGYGYTGGTGENQKRIQLFDYLRASNIYVTGRNNGVIFFKIGDPTKFCSRKSGSWSGSPSKTLKTNTIYIFENIHTHKFNQLATRELSNFHFHVNIRGDITYDSISIMPDVYIKNCGELVITPIGSCMNLKAENSIINSYNSEYYGFMRGKAVFNECIIRPDVVSSASNPYLQLSSVCGTYLNNCILDIPSIGGVEDVTKLFSMGLISDNYQIVGGLYFNNCRVSDRFSPTVDTTMKRVLMQTEQLLSDLTAYNNIRRRSGTTAQRPNANCLNDGDSYRDTTLNKVIFWNGSAWIDINGTTV